MSVRETAIHTRYAEPRSEATDAKAMRKVALASAIGNTIEYYDFTLYATATALVFNKIFFPSDDPLVGTLAAFATFFVGYCARPLGGILFGHFGDRIGRKTALLLTMIIMGVGTFLIGLVPSYDTIGIWAPITLLILRLAQGIGIGGEYGGGMVMTVEHAPADRRGFFSSLVHIGVPAGFLIPIALLGILSSQMDEASFMSWGWRLPFLFSIVLVAVGLFIRFQISETPEFKRILDEGKAAEIPVVEAVKNHRRNIVLGIGAKIAESGLFNIYAVFAIAYCVNVLGLPRQVILNGVLVGCALECITLPFFGALSDKIGRRAVYIGGMLFQAVLAFAFFALLDSGNVAYIWLAIALGLAIGHGSVFGAQGAFFSELFPARIRYSGLSLVQQIGPILGGGVSPLIATTLLAEYPDNVMPIVLYMALMAVFSAVCALALRPAAGA
ncbi:MFS transporter [Brucella intermedia]|uniref:MFS transporter n=1 Tax=Brucella intermedia TaxID=94625 RepID=UPI00224B4E22|nr:MFS transporter [Brucella intermedia]